MSHPPQASSSTSTSTLQTQHDAPQPELSPDLHSNPISQLLLTLPEIEKKYRKRLSEPIERYIRDAIPGPTATTATESGVDVTAGFGKDAKEVFEDDLERRTWKEGMRYRAESGGFSVTEGVLEDREVGRMRKRVTDEFERRE
jgi:hypothetical protein